MGGHSKMKKLFAVVLALVMATSLIACGTKESKKDDSNDAKKLKVGFIYLHD